MELIFEDSDGETRTMRAIPSATVADLKQHVALLCDVTSSHLKLSVRSVLLDNDLLTLRDYGLTSGFRLPLKIDKEATFPVNISNLKAKWKTYVVTNDETVDQLMEEVSLKEETPVDQIRLYYNAEPLRPGSKLKDYNIGVRSNICMKQQ